MLQERKTFFVRHLYKDLTAENTCKIFCRKFLFGRYCYLKCWRIKGSWHWLSGSSLNLSTFHCQAQNLNHESFSDEGKLDHCSSMNPRQILVRPSWASLLITVSVVSYYEVITFWLDAFINTEMRSLIFSYLLALLARIPFRSPLPFIFTCKFPLMVGPLRCHTVTPACKVTY